MTTHNAGLKVSGKADNGARSHADRRERTESRDWSQAHGARQRADEHLYTSLVLAQPAGLGTNVQGSRNWLPFRVLVGGGETLFPVETVRRGP